jgi:hypothetical protein
VEKLRYLGWFSEPLRKTHLWYGACLTVVEVVKQSETDECSGQRGRDGVPGWISES